MASILAIVSKKVFERDFRVGGKPAGIGDVVATTTYASTHASLDKLSSGGDLFLVTVSGDDLWLAGVLVSPKSGTNGWTARANTMPITDITSLIPKLAFENGKGLTAKPGQLGMSLQTPRTLADSDVELLRGASGGTTAKPAKAEPPAKLDDAAMARASLKRAKAETKAAKAVTAPKVEKPATNTSVMDDDDAPPLVISSGAAVGGDLTSVEAQLAAGAYAAALDGLLTAWQRTKAAEIADLIDQLGEWAAKNLPAIEGNKNTIGGAFSDVADLLRPLDIPRLIVVLHRGSSPQVADWLDILDRFPVDPRLCAPAIELCTKYVASSAGPSRTRAFRMAEKVADGRCLPQIEKLLKKNMDAWNTKDLKDRIRKMQAKFAPPPALPAADKPVVAALAKTIGKLVKQPSPDPAALFRAAAKATKGTATGDSLLAEVLANPDDDAARLVYADFLQQAGDPRGELIALQMQPKLTTAQRERVAKLIKDKANITRWLGPLAAVVKEPVFERGFLYACTIELKTAKHRELLAHPLWSTVREARCNDVVVLEHLHSLRKLSGAKIADLAKLVHRKEPLAIAELADIELSLVVDQDDRRSRNDLPLWEELCRVGAFANLRALGMAAGWQTVRQRGELDGFTWLFGSKLGNQLERVAIDLRGGAPQLARWLPVFATHARLAHLELRSSVGYYQSLPIAVAGIAKRDGEQLALALRLVRALHKGEPVDVVVQRIPGLLDGLPTKQTAKSLHVDLVPAATTKQIAAVQAHLAQVIGDRFDITVTG